MHLCVLWVGSSMHLPQTNKKKNNIRSYLLDRIGYGVHKHSKPYCSNHHHSSHKRAFVRFFFHVVERLLCIPFCDLQDLQHLETVFVCERKLLFRLDNYNCVDLCIADLTPV